MKGHHLLAWLLAFAAVAPAPGAQGIRGWRTPDGTIHLGENPPAGSIELDTRALEPEPPDADVARPAAAEDEQRRFSVEASLRRREIEKKLSAAAERLAAIRQATREVEDSRLEGRPYALATESDVAEAANFQDEKARRLNELRGEERAALAEIERLRVHFDRLRAEVTERYGGTPPPWWRDTLRCPKCPAG